MKCIHGTEPHESCEPCWQMGGKIYEPERLCEVQDCENPAESNEDFCHEHSLALPDSSQQ